MTTGEMFEVLAPQESIVRWRDPTNPEFRTVHEFFEDTSTGDRCVVVVRGYVPEGGNEWDDDATILIVEELWVATPSPALGPVPTADTPGCTLDAVFEADVTVPDNTEIEGGQPFAKTWRIRNTGSCDWGPGYRWTFVDGEQMGGPDSVAVPETANGDSVEISVELVAPSESGQHRGYWQMCNSEGQCFGDRVYVQIISITATTPQP